MSMVSESLAATAPDATDHAVLAETTSPISAACA
jgi:hypothetical protein